jgi:dUTP pyrophosphatase
LYSEQAVGTLISPTAITKQYSEVFEGWTLFANTTNSSGYMKLIHHDGINHATLPMFCEDRLWYHYLNTNDSQHIEKPSIRRLSNLSEYTLWHHRLGHPSDAVMQNMHLYDRGIPKLKVPDFYKCQMCALGKIKKDSSTKLKGTLPPAPIQPKEQIHPGQHLHADFGFVRGSTFSQFDEHGRLITSADGFRSYLIIVDRATRYKWIFLTKTRHPPLKELCTVLQKHKMLTSTLNCTIRTDQGGELGKSHKFQQLVDECGYTYEPTGSNSSKQNGMAERPNQVTRCLLHASGLSSAYWSYALNHSNFLLNSTYHSAIGMTPHQAMFKTQLNLSDLKIFGAKCYYKHTKKNQKAMDIAGEAGTFLGYSSTRKNVYVKNDQTSQVHLVLHKSYDEAHMTMNSENIPPMAKALQRAGYDNSCSKHDDRIMNDKDDLLQVQLLSNEAKLPTKSTQQSVGYDIYSVIYGNIAPGEHIIIPTDIAIHPNGNCYAQILTRSSMAMKGISVLGRVIDPDYTGNVKVILQNNSKQPFEINKNQRIAQLVFKQIQRPTIVPVKQLNTTEWGEMGFGSTEVKETVFPKTEISKPAVIKNAIAPQDSTIDFSNNPYENEITITIDNNGTHPTRGLDVIMNDAYNKVQLLACNKGTPAGRINKWRSTLRNALLLDFNGTPTTSIRHLNSLIENANEGFFKIKFGTIDKHAMHPQQGVPQLYFDQLNQIGRHLFALEHEPEWQSVEKYYASPKLNRMRSGIIPKGRRRGAKLTRRKLQLRPDWSDWKASEFKQLNQYETQQMFEEPCIPPKGANILPFYGRTLLKTMELRKHDAFVMELHHVEQSH